MICFVERRLTNNADDRSTNYAKTNADADTTNHRRIVNNTCSVALKDDNNGPAMTPMTIESVMQGRRRTLLMGVALAERRSGGSGCPPTPHSLSH